MSIVNEGSVNPYLPTNIHIEKQNIIFLNFVHSLNLIIELVSGLCKARFTSWKMSNKITFYHTFNIITTVIHTTVIFRLNQTNLHWKIPIIYLLWSQIEVPRKVGSISSGFELAICESCFSLIGFVFSRITLGNFLWNPQISFPSVRTFVFSKTTKFLFTLQTLNNLLISYTKKC